MIFCDWSHWWTRLYHLLMKTWPGDLPVGILGDLQAMFSSVTVRGEFTIHIWILGPSDLCAVSWGKFTFLFGFGVWVKCVQFFNFILLSSSQVHHYKCILVQNISTWIYIFKPKCQWMYPDYMTFPFFIKRFGVRRRMWAFPVCGKEFYIFFSQSITVGFTLDHRWG